LIILPSCQGDSLAARSLPRKGVLL
jgi:hypothetical protein